MGKKLTYNFTQEFIKNIPTPLDGKRTVYYDMQQRNLSIIVTPKGSKSFYVQRTHRGLTTRFFIGRVHEKDLRTARADASDYARAIADGKSKREILNQPVKELTLNDFASYYIQNYAKAHKASWQYEESNYNVHVRPMAFSKNRIAAIKPGDIQELHLKIGNTRGKVIANRVAAMLSVMFNQAIKDGYYPHPNPVRDIKKFKEYSRSRFLTGDELPAFFAALEKCLDRDMRDYILLCLFTGARKGNVLTMRWEHIDFASEEWRIPRTKNGDAQTIPLVKSAMDILMHRCSGRTNEYVFPAQRSKSKTPHMVEVKRKWELILIAAGFKDANGTWLREKLTLHDLRRTSGSWQTKMGANAFIVGKSLGHKSPKSTSIYARLDLDPVRCSMNKAADAMLEFGSVVQELPS